MIKYLNIPLEWLRVLTPAEAVVLAYIDLKQRKYGSYTGTLKELAEACGYNDVRSILNGLCNNGILSKQRVLRSTDGRYIQSFTINHECVNMHSQKRKYALAEAQIRTRECVNTHPIPFSKIKITNKGGEISAQARDPTPQRIILEEWCAHNSRETGQKVTPDEYDLPAAAEVAEKLDTLIGGKPPEEFRGAAAYLFQRGLQTADQWQRDHWSLQAINAQFAQIVRQITNDTQPHERKQSDHTAADAILRRGAEELRRAVENGIL